MTDRYIVAPYTPDEWESAQSDLKIDPVWYKDKLTNRWPNIEFYDPQEVYGDKIVHPALMWGLPVPYKTHITCQLHHELQRISLDIGVAEFFVWHRKIIDNKYRLYIYKLFIMSVTEHDYLELTSDISIEDIREFRNRH